jgi:response regulator RpfG family c-di-GMP phosphodiesterase
VTNEKVLFVDDEENVLAAFRRQLRKEFEVFTAGSGAIALDLLMQDGPFAVVVADMKMPEMDGVNFLARVKEISPNTSRMILTGYAELSTAIDAVNNGKIFRFLTKPCSTQDLVQAVQSGIQQYRLVTAEQELLEKTLGQSVQLLHEIFSLTTPIAFSRTLRLQSLVQHICARMNLVDVWQYKLAAMLSQIGCIVISPMVLEKINNGRPLTADEEKMFASHPAIGSRLIRNIPRLEVVAEMVASQLRRYDEYGLIVWSREEQDATLGAQILKAAQDYDQLIQNNLAHAEALEVMKTRDGWYNPAVLRAVEQGPFPMSQFTFTLADSRSLMVGMILDEDIFSRDGRLLGERYSLVTDSLLELLQSEGGSTGIVEPFRVYARNPLMQSPL